MKKQYHYNFKKTIASVSLCLGMLMPMYSFASPLSLVPDSYISSDAVDEEKENFSRTNPSITSEWTQEDWECLKKMKSKERKMYLSYLEKEPELSKVIKKVVDSTNGCMAGFEHRGKRPSSLYNKLYLRPQKKKISEVDDILRYTEILPEEYYTTGVKETLDSFAENGWQVNTLWNAWTITELPYQGLNVSLINKDGLMAEIQFHTEKSFTVKNSEEDHKLYEQRRLLKEGSPEYNQILEKQKALYRNVVVPEGVETIQEETVQNVA